MKKYLNKKTLITLIIGLALGVIVKDILQTIYYKKVEGFTKIGEIVVINEFVNVRSMPTTRAKKVYEANKGETYNVVEIFKEELEIYTWYKVVFSDRKIGWIASLNENPYVKEVK